MAVRRTGTPGAGGSQRRGRHELRSASRRRVSRLVPPSAGWRVRRARPGAVESSAARAWADARAPPWRRRAAGSAAPARPASWAATVGQPGSRAPRVQVEAAQAGGAAGQHQRADDADAVAQPDGEVGEAAGAQLGDARRVGGLRRRARPDPGTSRSGGARVPADGQEPPHRGLGGGQPLAARGRRRRTRCRGRRRAPAPPVSVCTAPIPPCSRPVTTPTASGPRPRTTDDAARPGPGRPLRAVRVDQRAGSRPAARSSCRATAAGTPRAAAAATSSAASGGPVELVEQRGQRRRQAVDDERGVRIEPDDPCARAERQHDCGAGRAAPGGQRRGLRVSEARSWPDDATAHRQPLAVVHRSRRTPVDNSAHAIGAWT